MEWSCRECGGCFRDEAARECVLRCLLETVKPDAGFDVAVQTAGGDFAVFVRPETQKLLIVYAEPRGHGWDFRPPP